MFRSRLFLGILILALSCSPAPSTELSYRILASQPVGVAELVQRVPPSPSATALQSLLDVVDYIEFARRLPQTSGLTPEDTLYFKGILAYRQGRFGDAIRPLISAVNTPNTSLTSYQVEQALETLGDAAAKTFQYKNSVQMYDQLIAVFGARMGEAVNAIRVKRDFMAALQAFPPQTIQIDGDFSMKPTGAEYSVTAGGRELLGVLDTGASYTILSDSAAKTIGVSPLDGSVILRGYSGDTFNAHPAIIPVLQIGNAQLHNVGILITADQNLLIAGIRKQTNVILGYSVVSSLGSLTFVKDGTLTIHARSANITQVNDTAMWVGNSSLLITLNTGLSLDNGNGASGAGPRLFDLDTASSSTYLTNHYLAEHRDLFSGSPTEAARLSGVGGIKTIPAYSSNGLPLWFGSTKVLLNGQHVLAEPQAGEAQNYFGVIGQDLLRQLSTYTIDFRTMKFSSSN